MKKRLIKAGIGFSLAFLLICSYSIHGALAAWAVADAGELSGASGDSHMEAGADDPGETAPESAPESAAVPDSDGEESEYPGLPGDGPGVEIPPDEGTEGPGDTAQEEPLPDKEGEPGDDPEEETPSGGDSELELPGEPDGGPEETLPPGDGDTDADKLEEEALMIPESSQLQDAKAFVKGSVTIDKVVYEHGANGEATLVNGSAFKGVFTVPKEIVGQNGATYLVTEIGTYVKDGRTRGAFQGSGITGLLFEEGSRLKKIEEYAFGACYGLSGTSIHLPESLTYVGGSAFFMYEDDEGIDEIRHPHLAQVEGSLPPLGSADPIEVPEDARAYESVVDSSSDNTVLHKGASWTNERLTEAEIRIDYGEPARYSGKFDFIFVLDHSSSMVASSTWTSDSGESYTYPRSFLTTDVVYGVSKILLDHGMDGYDNRIALTAFGSSPAPLWEMDFSGNSQDIEETLFQNPLTLTNNTYYSVGLQSAIDLVNARQDKSRTPVVIFLSDGEPTDSSKGAKEAEKLREMGVRVYPVAIFTPPNTALTAISYDKKTAYNANSATAFETILMEVVEDILKQGSTLTRSIRDVLSSSFQLATGTQQDILVSDGGALWRSPAIPCCGILQAVKRTRCTISVSG